MAIMMQGVNFKEATYFPWLWGPAPGDALTIKHGRYEWLPGCAMSAMRSTNL